MSEPTTLPTPLPKRLLSTTIKFIALTASMYFIPTFMHSIVRSLDDVYGLLGRRTQSTEVSWIGLGIATMVLGAWHLWLGRLSYISAKSVSGKRGGWAKVLGYVLVPVTIGVLGLGFGWEVLGKAFGKRDVVGGKEL